MLARGISVFLGSVALLLAGNLAVGAQTWTKHSYATDGFDVEFSGDVKVVPTNLDDATKKKVSRSTDYQQDAGEYVYIVGASLLLVPVNFENGIKQSFAALKCKMTATPTDLNVAGGRGRELRGSECHDGSYRVDARYYTTGRWFYQVIALYKSGAGFDQGVRHFVESFKMTGKK